MRSLGLILVLAAVSTLALAQKGPPPSSDCNSSSTPGSSQVIIYQHSSFRGSCRVLEIGMYPSSSWFGLSNDSISSVKVGSNVNITMFDNALFDALGHIDRIKFGISQTHLSSWPHDGGTWNDEVSSLRVILKEFDVPCITSCPAGVCSREGLQNGQVELFTERSFNGHENFCIRDSCDCILKWGGSFEDTGEIGLENDTISSMRLGPFTSVYICQDSFYNLPCRTIDNRSASTMDIPILSGSPGNDAISSFIIRF